MQRKQCNIVFESYLWPCALKMPQEAMEEAEEREFRKGGKRTLATESTEGFSGDDERKY